MEKTLREIVGERVAELRERANWSQGELAAKAKIGRVTINRIEGAIQSPSIEFLVELARTLHTTPDYLLGFTDASQPHRRRTGTKRPISVAV